MSGSGIGLVVSIFGPLSIATALLVMGLLSRKLGRVTKAAPYYLGFFVAAFLVGVSVFVRIILLTGSTSIGLQNHTLKILLVNGLPAVGVTLGVSVAWRYWSWLLAERD